MFWHVDEQLLGVDEIMDHSEKMMARAMDKMRVGTIDESDDVLLRQALRHVYAHAFILLHLTGSRRSIPASRRPKTPYGAP